MATTPSTNEQSSSVSSADITISVVIVTILLLLVMCNVIMHVVTRVLTDPKFCVRKMFQNNAQKVPKVTVLEVRPKSSTPVSLSLYGQSNTDIASLLSHSPTFQNNCEKTEAITIIKTGNEENLEEISLKVTIPTNNQENKPAVEFVQENKAGNKSDRDITPSTAVLTTMDKNGTHGQVNGVKDQCMLDTRVINVNNTSNNVRENQRNGQVTSTYVSMKQGNGHVTSQNVNLSNKNFKITSKDVNRYPGKVQENSKDVNRSKGSRHNTSHNVNLNPRNEQDMSKDLKLNLTNNEDASSNVILNQRDEQVTVDITLRRENRTVSPETENLPDVKIKIGSEKETQAISENSKETASVTCPESDVNITSIDVKDRSEQYTSNEQDIKNVNTCTEQVVVKDTGNRHTPLFQNLTINNTDVIKEMEESDKIISLPSKEMNTTPTENVKQCDAFGTDCGQIVLTKDYETPVMKFFKEMLESNDEMISNETEENDESGNERMDRKSEEQFVVTGNTSQNMGIKEQCVTGMNEGKVNMETIILGDSETDVQRKDIPDIITNGENTKINSNTVGEMLNDERKDVNDKQHSVDESDIEKDLGEYIQSNTSAYGEHNDNVNKDDTVDTNETKTVTKAEAKSTQKTVSKSKREASSKKQTPTNSLKSQMAMRNQKRFRKLKITSKTE